MTAWKEKCQCGHEREFHKNRGKLGGVGSCILILCDCKKFRLRDLYLSNEKEGINELLQN